MDGWMERRVLMYHSSKLDNMETGQAGCAIYLAALAKAISKTSHIVMCSELTINTTHGVVTILASSAFTFSTARKTKISRHQHGKRTGHCYGHCRSLPVCVTLLPCRSLVSSNQLGRLSPRRTACHMCLLVSISRVFV